MRDEESHSRSRAGAWKWISGVIVGVLAALGLWLWLRSHPYPPALAKIARSAQPAVAAWPPYTRMPAVTVPRAPAKTSEIEVCGVGKVKIDPNDPMAAGKYIADLSNKSRLRWLLALRNSDDYRARAAGLFLTDIITDHGNNQVAAQEARDELVQLAVGVNDPAVYALAIYKCSTNIEDPAAGACGQVSASGWARRDPDNAVPWLMVAGEARANNNTMVESDAIRDAAKAHKTDSYADSLFAFAEPEIPTDATAVERAYFAIDVIGVEAATATPQFIAGTKHCSSDALQDSTARLQCSALAELFVTDGRTLLDFWRGVAIGIRAGWPKERVTALTEEKDALMQVSTQVLPENADPWSCDNVNRLNAFMGQVGRLGEMGATREALDRSGETVPELAAKWTAYLERIQRDAALQAPQPATDPSP
jgi:hypothetical protein